MTKNPDTLLKVMRKNIILRSLLIVITLILTVVLIFSLTAAWQTNVVQTGGLTFTAENWNFSGEILIGDLTTGISPGSSGVIPVTLKNHSSSLVAASVTVSKDQLIAQMRNRMFFYVDGAAMRNGETMEKVYISSKSSYTYTVFPYSELQLTEGTLNSPLIKWEWVYDSLGYYVLGTATENSGITGVTVEEYIRPIEYDYDIMKTTFDVNGNLLTVDGNTDVEEFLAELSKTDGYAGNIDYEGRTDTGYYPVDVNENGYGVWAYLCTYSDIETASMNDTALGSSGASLGNVRVTVTGQNSREEGMKISTEEELLNALNTSGVHMLSLSQNMVLSQPVVLDGTSRAMIDLAGYTLTSSAATVFNAQPGSNLMVYNGTVQGSGSASTAFSTNGANITLSNVTVSNVGEGITIFDNKNDSGADSRVHLVGCSITAFEDGLWIYGNGAESERNTAIIIEDCSIEGTNYAGIICNGTYYGTDIRILRSTLSGKYTAVYFPQKNSTLTIEDSTLTGHTGLVVKGGTVNVKDSTITGTGKYNELPIDDPSKLSLSGWVDTGDGIYLEANYAWETVINISGESTVVKGTQEKTLAVRQFPDKTYSPQASINITGGTYNTDVSEYLESGYIVNEKTDGDTTVYKVVPKEEGTE